MTLMAGASTLCLQPLPFPVHVPRGFERFSMIDANGCPPPIRPDEVARIILGNETSEFERLRGVPGFQLDPVPWESVKRLVAENTTESLGKLGRSPAGQVVYWRFKGQVGSLSLYAKACCSVLNEDTLEFQLLQYFSSSDISQCSQCTISMNLENDAVRKRYECQHWRWRAPAY